jgi:16S rRNA (guanine(527)-N(7))-methyltransferase RsmG
VNNTILEMGDSPLLFCQLQKQYHLNDNQIEQFKEYAALLYQASTQFNITTLTSVHDIVYHHFMDSLALSNCFDLNTIKHCADIGSGGGFPGIPLKIAYPHLSVILIEVSSKKADFLRLVIDKLGLQGVMVQELDWRTFLRKTEYPLDIFVSRASLHTDELMRMFKPSSPYKNTLLIYWASCHWTITALEQPFFMKESFYTIGEKERKLVFFKLN